MDPDFSKAPPLKSPADLAAEAEAAAALDRAIALYNGGETERAGDLCRAVLARHPAHRDAFQLLGAMAIRAGDWAEAERWIGRALAIHPRDAAAQYQYGVALSGLGRPGDAVAAFERCLDIHPGSAAVYAHHGHALWLLQRHQAAVESYGRALEIKPDHAETLNNRGVALNDLGRPQAALADFDRAISLQPDYAAAHNNRGLALAALNRGEDARAAYDRAIALKDDFAEAHNNRGNALVALGHYDEALIDYGNAIRIAPGYADAYANRARALRFMKRYEACCADYDKTLELKPDYPFVFGTRLHVKMLMCDWRDFERQAAELEAKVARGEKATSPFPFLALTGAPDLQRKAAEIWTQARHPVSAPPYQGARAPQAGKIRIGYFSPDFRDHPVAVLAAGLFEAHDRARFEIYAFSYGPGAEDGLRKRLEPAFDRFIDVRNQTDAEIAALARNLGVDIAVDLAGHTQGARTGIFALRAAPVQASYVGYPASMGASFYDYIIADSTVIPEDQQSHFAEKIAYLPDFQVNDASREIANRIFTRAELGLPASGFVFCCFNNTFKITPRVFESWMRILKSVPGSVLFLYAETPAAASNLKAAAAAQGVDAGRLIFGKRLPMPEYLARFKSADLFLDTLPFNAGTTASDALWAGLPVLTCAGQSFAGRMAASLLQTLDLAALVTTTQRAYEDLAVALAADPARLRGLKEKLERERLNGQLFDARRFAGYLEQAYVQMLERRRAGLPPEDIHVQT
jgi:predicted O-linked N-acetylglucosamine transferase (SPINDLY family)